MTTQEHQVMIEMFQQQAMLYAGLVEILKSRDVIHRTDLVTFDTLVCTNRELVEPNIRDRYLESCRVLGVSVDEDQII